MSKNGTNLLLFINKDPSYCGEHYPRVLQQSLGYTHVADNAFRHIYLPATEKFPQLQLLSNEHPERPAAYRLCGEQLVPKGSGRTSQSFDETISELVYMAFLEEARGRTQRKLLPGFVLKRSIWRKEEGHTSILLHCDEISGLGPTQSGSYIFANCQSPFDELAQLKRSLVALLGARQINELTSYYDLLKHRHPDYTWRV